MYCGGSYSRLFKYNLRNMCLAIMAPVKQFICVSCNVVEKIHQYFSTICRGPEHNVHTRAAGLDYD